MSDSGKKLYGERAKTSGSYQPWDRLTKMAQAVWNTRAKTKAASKPKKKTPKKK